MLNVVVCLWSRSKEAWLRSKHAESSVVVRWDSFEGKKLTSSIFPQCRVRESLDCRRKTIFVTNRLQKLSWMRNREILQHKADGCMMGSARLCRSRSTTDLYALPSRCYSIVEYWSSQAGRGNNARITPQRWILLLDFEREHNLPISILNY